MIDEAFADLIAQLAFSSYVYYYYANNVANSQEFLSCFRGNNNRGCF